MKSSLKKQAGFTIIELFIVVAFFLALAIVGGLGYVAFHFIQKFW